jgi:hypothetical protein
MLYKKIESIITSAQGAILQVLKKELTGRIVYLTNIDPPDEHRTIIEVDLVKIDALSNVIVYLLTDCDGEIFYERTYLNYIKVLSDNHQEPSLNES